MKKINVDKGYVIVGEANCITEEEISLAPFYLVAFCTGSQRGSVVLRILRIKRNYSLVVRLQEYIKAAFFPSAKADDSVVIENIVNLQNL